ncbi:rubredoxin [Methanomicrobium sp. W14]|uniref:rubredoxin n=1 Tax=Methanomicrobium sp. W14 TaxID=2817839 RepID=UPI001AE43150|nr:rubredoxin [Methanomicrobium sp. W14]MBP2133027.1 rubredoxin [Methanomicrobium sp. W14]
MKVWKCKKCGYIYDERLGDSASGIAKGTAFEDLPDDWVCPRCGARKNKFEPIEIED